MEDFVGAKFTACIPFLWQLAHSHWGEDTRVLLNHVLYTDSLRIRHVGNRLLLFHKFTPNSGLYHFTIFRILWHTTDVVIRVAAWLSGNALVSMPARLVLEWVTQIWNWVTGHQVSDFGGVESGHGSVCQTRCLTRF